MFRKNELSRMTKNAIFGLGFFSYLFLGMNAYAQEGKVFSDLYKKAKEEGKVVFYASMEVTVAQDISDKFEAKFPGVKVEIYRAGSERLLTRAIAEGSAGKPLLDIIQLNTEKIGALKKHKLVAQYKPSSYSFYPKGFIDPEGYWTSFYINPCPIAYNTKLVKPNEVPQTWEELLDPKWKGKLAMDSTKYVWSIGIREFMGEEKGIKYLKDLAAQKINFRDGISNSLQMMTAGEFPMMVWSFIGSLERLKEKGAPLDWVRMKSPVPADVDTTLIGEGAPHPNAARLLYEFLLSKEGQEALAANEKTVARSDVESKNIAEIRKLDLRPSKPLTEEEFSRAAKLVRSIFGI